jgi:nucleoid-associated protein YgaU
MTSTTQPPQAMLADAAPNVRESVVAPAPAEPAPKQVTSVRPITPSNQVPTVDELRPQPPVQQPQPTYVPPGGSPVVTRVEVGGPVVDGRQVPTGPIAIRSPQPDSPIIITGAPEQQQEARQQPQPPFRPEQAGTGDEFPVVVTDEADANDEATAGLEAWLSGRPATPRKPEPAKVQTREYVAQAGDSLSRMASRLMGADTQANRDAIIAANPSLQKNPNLVIEGRNYLIPRGPASASTPKQPTPAPAARTATANAMPAKAKLPAIPETVPVPPRSAKATPVTELVETLPATAPIPDGNGTWYVVKENDNLWKIAAEQLGSGNAWTQIKDLNKDILKGKDTVVRNMRLRLPPKSVATAE